MKVKVTIMNIDDFIAKIDELREYLLKAEEIMDDLSDFPFEIKTENRWIPIERIYKTMKENGHE